MGSLEFCQCGGPVLIIKYTLTGRISAASAVDCSIQGHFQDNHTEKKFGNTAEGKSKNSTVRCIKVTLSHGCKTSTTTI